MPRLHLPVAVRFLIPPYFHTDFSGCRLRRVCLHFNFFYGHHAISLSCFNNGQVKLRRETAWRWCGYRAVIMWYPQPYKEILRRPGALAASVRALHVHYAAALWSPCGSRTAILKFLFQNDHLKSSGCLTITSRPPYSGRTMLLRRVYGLQAYDFYFRVQFRVIHNHRGHGDRMVPVKLYDIVRWLYRNGDIGIIVASFGRRGPNVNQDSDFLCVRCRSCVEMK